MSFEYEAASLVELWALASIDDGAAKQELGRRIRARKRMPEKRRGHRARLLSITRRLQRELKGGRA